MKCKNYLHLFSKNISIYAIFNDQSLKDTLTNNIISFEQLGPDCIIEVDLKIGLTASTRAQLFKANDIVT